MSPRIGRIVVVVMALLSFWSGGRCCFAAAPLSASDEERADGGKDIPGGIVYSDGTNAVYYDFKARKTSNLTKHIKGIVVGDEFGISESGRTLVWRQKSEFWSMDLPKGNPRPVQMEVYQWKGHNGRAVGFWNVQWNRPTRNIAVSPDESRIMFESVHQGMAWTFEKMTADAIPQGVSPSNPLLPFYSLKPASCVGIFFLSRNYNECNPPSEDPFAPRYGNVCEWPSVPQYRHILGIEAPGHTAIGFGETGDSENRIYPRRAVAKSAFFPAFPKAEMWRKERLMAFIFKLDNGQWGPIEIRTVDSPVYGEHRYSDPPDVSTGQGTAKVLSAYFRCLYPKLTRGDSYGSTNFPISNNKDYATLHERFTKPRHWEIQIPPMQSCSGLLWTSDGSIDIVDGSGKFHRISSQDVQRVISQSSITKLPSPHQRGEFFIKPTNNVIRVTPEPIGSYTMNGSCHTWVSDRQLIYLGQDKCVYYCTKAGKEKVHDAISSRFYYCSVSPLQSLNTATSGKGEFDCKRSTAFTGSLNNKVGSIRLGYIVTNPVGYNLRTYTGANGKETELKDYKGPVDLFVKQIGCQPPLEFCPTDKSDFSELGDVSQYRFKTERDGKSASATAGKIFLLRLEGRVVGIRCLKKPDTESTFSYEWKVISDNPQFASMEAATGNGAKKIAKPAKTAPASNSPVVKPDRGLPVLRATFSRYFNLRQIKFSWGRGDDDGEVQLRVLYKENLGELSFFVTADKTLADLKDASDFAGHKFEDAVKNIDNVKKTAVQKQTLRVGETIIMNLNNSVYLAFRPIAVEGNTVKYQRKDYSHE